MVGDAHKWTAGPVDARSLSSLSWSNCVAQVSISRTLVSTADAQVFGLFSRLNGTEFLEIPCFVWRGLLFVQPPVDRSNLEMIQELGIFLGCKQVILLLTSFEQQRRVFALGYEPIHPSVMAIDNFVLCGIELD